MAKHFSRLDIFFVSKYPYSIQALDHITYILKLKLTLWTEAQNSGVELAITITGVEDQPSHRHSISYQLFGAPMFGFPLILNRGTEILAPIRGEGL